MITVENEPEDDESALSARTRRKQRLVQDPFGSEYPSITLQDFVDHILSLSNRNNDYLQATVQETFQVHVDGAANLLDVLPTLCDIIAN